MPKVHRLDSKKKKKDKKKDKKEGEANGDHQNGDVDEETAEFDVNLYGVPVCGDVKLEFERKGEKMFAFWINTFFVKDLQMVVDKIGLDKAHKDVKSHKNYEEGFKVELLFTEMTNSTPRKLTTVSSSPSISNIIPPSPTASSSASASKIEGNLSNSNSV